MATKTRVRKNTKSYKEYQRLYKNLAEQTRYYKKLGIDLPDVKDAFRRSDASYKNLQQLKKFRTAYQASVKQVKKDIAQIRKTVGVDTSTAYKILSRERTDGALTYDDVVIANFKYQIANIPNLKAREKLSDFIAEYEASFEDRQQLAEILKDTAENDRAFEVMKDYLKGEELLTNMSELMNNLIGKMPNMPVTADKLRDLMDLML